MSEQYKLPEGWRWVKLGEVCETNPRRPKNFERPSEAPTTFVPMAAVDEKKGAIANPEIVPYSKVSKGYTYFEENDVLFAKITPCMQNGKHVIARNLIDGIGFGTTEFHVLRPNHEILPEWIHFFIRQSYFLEEATLYFTGAVGQQRVPESFLTNYIIPLPPIDVQHRIASKLQELMEQIDRARSACEKQLEAANALPSAYLREVFESEEAKKWERKRLGEVFDLQQGAAMSPKRRLGINPHPFLRTKNILWGRLDLSEVDKMDFSEDEIAKLSLKDGDLLVCEGGEVGKTAIWRGEIETCLYQNHIHRLRRRNEGVIPEFFMYWMQAAFQVFSLYKGQSSNTTIPNLSGTRLAKFIVPFPPQETQHRLVSYLKEKVAYVQNLQSAIRNQQSTLEALPQAILRKAFRGEL